jgi:hypothetical protein
MQVFTTSPSDTAHRTGRLDEIRLPDPVPRFLPPHDFHQPPRQLVIRCSTPQQRPQIVLSNAEQARPDLSIRCQPQSVAMPAERLTHRRNHADLAAPTRRTLPLRFDPTETAPLSP